MNPDALMGELFEKDEWVENQFRAHLGRAHPRTVPGHARVYLRLLMPLNDVASKSEASRHAFVGPVLFSLLDELLASTKLLRVGQPAAAGSGRLSRASSSPFPVQLKHPSSSGGK